MNWESNNFKQGKHNLISTDYLKKKSSKCIAICVFINSEILWLLKTCLLTKDIKNLCIENIYDIHKYTEEYMLTLLYTYPEVFLEWQTYQFVNIFHRCVIALALLSYLTLQ